MEKSVCNLVLDVKVVSENPVQIKDFGMEKIYEVVGEYIRTSNKTDRFFIDYSDGLTAVPKFGDYIRINGTLRNIVVNEEGSDLHYTKVYILAKSITILDEEPEIYSNEIKFENVELVNVPELRKSYTDSSIDITDIKIRVQRNSEKFNIFKCTLWNNNARLIVNYDKGTRFNIIGRLQSKQLKNGGLRTEISVNSLSLSCEEEKKLEGGEDA